MIKTSALAYDEEEGTITLSEVFVGGYVTYDFADESELFTGTVKHILTDSLTSVPPVTYGASIPHYVVGNRTYVKIGKDITWLKATAGGEAHWFGR